LSAAATTTTAATTTVTLSASGRRVRLDDRHLLGVGGEGRVFRSGDLALKIFFSTTDARKKKLAAFPTGLPDAVVGPRELCTDRRGDVVGFAMRALDGAVDIHRFGQRKWRDANATTASDVLATFRELAATVATLHARRIVVGDLNDGNVVVTRDPHARPGPASASASASASAWRPWLIDADSMQFASFPCVVAHERFLDPRLYGVDLAATRALSPASDHYALAVMLFTSLLFVHPFGGAHASYPTMLRRAEARHSVLRGDVKLPASAARPDVLPDDALAWFTDVFDRDARAALPPSLLATRFTRCTCGVEHARRVCPACAVRVAMPAAPPPPPVKTLGRIRVTTMTRDEGARFISASLDHAKRVRLDGDWLVRADGTRIGQVLENQTHVRAGKSLGIAFYRAGLFTMSFVFDMDRGPLRQLDLPHLEGRLVDWSASFDGASPAPAGARSTPDDGHVLFSTATEKDGRVIHAAHLVDAKGAILASETGPAGSSPMLQGITGKCLAGGAVLAPTDDGLLLVRADRATRTFVPARAFPETRDLVPPDADLIVGPGGSVYAVTHDRIVHLSFEGSP
jgi:hypothetical protein